MSQEPVLLDALNERELEIIDLLSDGLSNREIAAQLFLAPSTVKWYVRQLNSKLDTQNRNEIIERASKLGLINAEAPESYLRPRHNLPHQTTPFVGRDSELDELRSILQKPDVRLLTILAPGGMGKTRIALEATEQQLNNFPDGVYFVPLQALTEIDQIVPAIATSTFYQFQADDRSQKQQLLDFLSKKQMLLLIDNWEHLLDGVSLINEILSAAPNVKILATSREKLNLLGETVYVLQGMEFPSWETPEDALRYDAVQLLVQAARRVQPDWDVTQDDLDNVARVCRLTQGMPLGILLAMSWLDILPIAEIAVEIEKSVDFLATDMRDVPERQQSIRAIFNYAWNKLSEAEQDVFMSLSVFRGGFTRQAADEVTGANLRILQSLVNKALLQVNKSGRYDVHELLRQYGEEQLEGSGGTIAVRNAHMSYYATALYELESKLKGSEQIEALNAMETDFENVRVAWFWAFQQSEYKLIDKMIEAISFFCRIRNRYPAGEELFIYAVDCLSDTENKRLLSRLQSRRGMFFLATGDFKQAEVALQGSLVVAQEDNDREEMAFCLKGLSGTLHSLGNLPEALESGKEALSLYQRLDNKWGIAATLFILGYIYGDSGNIITAREHTLQSFQLFREMGNESGMAVTLNNLAAQARWDGNWDLYEDYHQQALTLRREISNPSGIVFSTIALAEVKLRQGLLAEASQLARGALEISKDINVAEVMPLPFLALGRIADKRGDYEEAFQLTAEGYHYAQVSGNLGIITGATLQLGWSLCCREAYDKAIKHLVDALPTYLDTKGISFLIWGLASFTPILRFRGQREQATEMLGLLFEQATPFSLLDKHPKIDELKQTLREELGENAYNTAYSRGKELNLETVVGKLLEEFGNGN